MKHALVVGGLCLLAGAARAESEDAPGMGRRVQDVLHAHQADVYACVQAQPKQPDGEMLIRVFVGENGSVARADVLKDQSGGGSLGACLAGKIAAWDLASLGAAPGDQVVFPLAFRSDARRARVVKRGEASAWPLPGGKGTARLYLDGTGAQIALDELTAEAGASIPAHRHEGSDEVVHVLSGRATTVIDGKKLESGPGDTLFIPAGAEHAMTVVEKLTAIQVYSPAGPEQRFKKGPK